MKNIKMDGNPVTVLGSQIKVGDKAPDIILCRDDFSEFKLSEYFGKRILISAFLSIDTGVCANQTRHFNKAAANLEDLVIISVSKDLPSALKRFCAAEGIDNVITSSDYKYNDFGDKYGFLVAETKLLARGNVFIDTDGIVKYVEYVDDTSHEPDYDTLLAFLKHV